MFYKGRDDLGRSSAFTQTDFYLSYDIKLGGTKKVQLSMNVVNLLDRDSEIRVWPNRYRDRIVISNEAFFAGFNADALATQQNRCPDAEYGQPHLFQNPREIRLGMKFAF